MDQGYANFVEIVIAEVQLRRIPLLKLSDKSLDGPQGFVLEAQLPKALRRHALRTPSRPSLIGDLGDRVCTATSSLGPSHLSLPGTVFRDEDLQAHIEVFVLREDDNDNKVNVYSNAALLPQDFESADAVSQRQPEAQGWT